jgi:hypothetical protein
MTKPQFMFVPPITAVPPVTADCERIATNQLAPQGFHWEPLVEAPNEWWVGDESGTIGRHVEYAYASYTTRPPPVLVASDADTATTGGGCTIPMSVQDGDMLVAFAMWEGVAPPVFNAIVWNPGTPYQMAHRALQIDTTGDIKTLRVASLAIDPNNEGAGDVSISWAAGAAGIGYPIAAAYAPPEWAILHVYHFRFVDIMQEVESDVLVGDSTPQLSVTTSTDYQLLVGAIGLLQSGDPSLRLVNFRSHLNTQLSVGAGNQALFRSGIDVWPNAQTEDFKGEITGYVDADVMIAALSIDGTVRGAQLEQQFIVLQDVEGSGFFDGEGLSLASY